MSLKNVVPERRSNVQRTVCWNEITIVGIKALTIQTDNDNTMYELMSCGKLGAVFKSKLLLFHMHTGGHRQVIPHIIRNGSWRIRNRGSCTVFQPCLCFFGGVWSCCIVSVLFVSCYWACFCSLNAPVFWRCFHLCVKSFICYGRPHVFVPCFVLIFPQWAFFFQRHYTKAGYSFIVFSIQTKELY